MCVSVCVLTTVLEVERELDALLVLTAVAGGALVQYLREFSESKHAQHVVQRPQIKHKHHNPYEILLYTVKQSTPYTCRR